MLELLFPCWTEGNAREQSERDSTGALVSHLHQLKDAHENSEGCTVEMKVNVHF